MSTPPVPSLSQLRERAIEQLSAHFAQDDLTLEELERRIERAYRAENAVELDALTADLRERATLPSPPRSAPQSVAARTDAGTPEYDRILAVMSETRRTGLWSVPQRLDLVSIMSDTRIDLSSADLPDGVVDVHVRAVWTSLKIILPPGLRVVNRMSAFMASVTNDTDEVAAPPSGPVVRLTGLALMAEVKLIVADRGGFGA